MKTGKRILSVLLSVLLLFGTAAFGGTVATAEETYSVGDTLQYGTYPQSKVEDEATLTALNAKLNDDGWVSYGYYSGTNTCDDGQMQPGDWMKYQDVVYKGARYRAVLFEHYRPYVTGYSYWPANSLQEDNGYSTGTTYWFKFKPIVWKVLDPDSGLIVCNSAIDSQAYNNYILSADGEYYGNAEKTYRANDYANSSIRAWLNNDFKNTAFSSSQQENIKVTELDNSCPYDSNYDSANTSDKIFLLSYNEVTNSEYGFNSDAESSDTARHRTSSDYAKCQGIYKNYAGNSYWWLRSPYNNSYNACRVHIDGYADGCSYVYFTREGVVPALRLQELKSDPISYEPGDIIEYGTYPQSGVTDEATVAALNAALTDDGWVSYGYYSGTDTWDDGQMTSGDWMRYQDAVLDGVKYRAVTFDSYRPYATGFTSSSNFQSSNGYSTGTTYWFKFEPIEWKVLDPDSGLIVCNSAIDSQAYNNYILSADCEYWGNADKTYYANDYANSSIRVWLNNDFKNTAFSSSQQENIKVTELDNSCPYDSNYDSANTSDKIFLLSYNEVTNSEYGFNSNASAEDTARQRTSSDYANCQGIYKNSAGNSYWWLRSPHYYSYDACDVFYYGYADNDDTVGSTYDGVVPALKLQNLESDPTGVPVTAEPEMEMTAEDINYGETATVNVSLPDGATGDVTFYLDAADTGKKVEVSEGKAICTFKNLAIGEHTVEAVYSGNGSYEGKTVSTTFNVNSVNCLLTINYVYAEGGEAATTYTEDVEIFTNYSVISPEITGYTPDKETVEGSMGNDDMGGKTVTVTYTANMYTATLVADGQTVDKIPFTYGQKSITLPAVPKKEGHTGEWENYSLGAEDITINAIYKPNTYTVTFLADGKIHAEMEVTFGEAVPSPRTPSKENYDFKGWDAEIPETMPAQDLTFNAVFEKINPTASAKLKVKSSTTVDYRSKVNITATASGVPDGYVLAIYEGKTLREKGTKDKVTYTPVDSNGKPIEFKSDTTYTVKIIDVKNNVQKDANGKDLTAKIEIKVKSGFFDKLIAFFKGLFGLLPTVEIKP